MSIEGPSGSKAFLNAIRTGIGNILGKPAEAQSGQLEGSANDITVDDWMVCADCGRASEWMIDDNGNFVLVVPEDTTSTVTGTDVSAVPVDEVFADTHRTPQATRATTSESTKVFEEIVTAFPKTNIHKLESRTKTAGKLAITGLALSLTIPGGFLFGIPLIFLGLAGYGHSEYKLRKGDRKEESSKLTTSFKAGFSTPFSHLSRLANYIVEGGRQRHFERERAEQEVQQKKIGMEQLEGELTELDAQIAAKNKAIEDIGIKVTNLRKIHKGIRGDTPEKASIWQEIGTLNNSKYRLMSEIEELKRQHGEKVHELSVMENPHMRYFPLPRRDDPYS